MKEIEIFEIAKANGCKDLRKVGINPTMFWAYFESKEAGNDLIDFSEVIWDDDISDIVEICRENNIKEFTISSSFSGLIRTLAEFEKHGCKIFGLMQVNEHIANYMTGKRETIPAIKMCF